MSLDNDLYDDQFIRRACDAALRSDAAGLGEIICCRKDLRASNSLNTPLLSSTKQAQMLHRRLFENRPFMDPKGLPDGCRPDHVLRALLLVPPALETPWVTIFDFILIVQSASQGNDKMIIGNSSQPALRTNIADIQSFLQQTVASWWEKERRSSASEKVRTTSPHGSSERLDSCQFTARDWLVRILTKLVEPLTAKEALSTVQLGDKCSKTKDECWIVCLELVPTILSLIHDLEQSLKHEILDIIFHMPNIRPDRLLPWLTLATELYPFLRQCDWDMLLLVCQRTDEDHHCTAFFSKQDLPGLMTAIVSLSFHSLNEQNTKLRLTKRRTFRMWRLLALRLLHSASMDPGTFFTVATVLQGDLSALPSEAIREWTLDDEGDRDVAPAGKPSNTTDDNDIPTWIRANVIIISLQAAHKSGSQRVNNLLSRALSRNAGRCDLVLDGWKTLVGLAFSQQDNDVKKQTVAIAKLPWIENLQRICDGTGYAGAGLFDNEEGLRHELLSELGSLIHHSLFLAPSRQQVRGSAVKGSTVYVLERAQGWISAANNRLKVVQKELSTEDSLLIAVIFIVIFCEVPKSRSYVVRCMLQSISGEADYMYAKKDIALLHCLVVSVIVSAKPTVELTAGPTELQPIIDLLAAGKLPKKIFFPLAKAAATSSEAAKVAALSAARKHLNAPVGNVWWDDNKVDESCDRIQCGLYSLCILIGSKHRDACTVEAWKLLSETVVLNRPPLPTAARSWLFQLLRKLLASNTFGLPTVKQLFRVCLLRILHFVDADRASNRMMISARHILNVWCTTNTSEVQSAPVEDLPGLYLLLSELFFWFSVNSNGDGDHDIDVLRRSLICQTYGFGTKCKAESLAILQADLLDDYEQVLHSKVLIQLLACAIDLVTNCLSDEASKIDSHSKNIMKLEVGHIRNAIVAQELKAFESLALNEREAENLKPLWFVSVADPKHICSAITEPPDEAVQTLALSLADVLITVLEDHRWTGGCNGESLFIDEQGGLLQTIRFLANCRQKLSTSSPNIGCNRINPASYQKLFIDFGTTVISTALTLDATIERKGPLSDAVAILSVFIGHLDTLNHFLRCEFEAWSLADMDFGPVLYSLWQFYDFICSEESAIQFISYLENMSMPSSEKRHERWAQYHRIALYEIDSSESVDARVRYIRLSLLNTLKQCLSILARHDHLALKLFTFSPFLGRSMNQKVKCFRWCNMVKVSPTDFLSECLHRLVSDLQAGLNGQSGAVTQGMYMAFIDSMDFISRLLTLFLQQTRNLCTLVSLVNVCEASANALQAVICAYFVRKKKMFRKAFLLAAQSLPRAARCAGRKARFLEGDINIEDMTILPKECSFAVQCFENCMDTLKMWIGSTMLSEISWAKVLVPAKVFDNNIYMDDDSDCIHFSDDQVERSGVPAEVTITHQNHISQKSETSTESGAQIPLDSKERWSWVCLNALLALEHIWIDSFNIIHRRDRSLGRILCLPLSPSILDYAKLRTKEFANVARSLCLAFSRCHQTEAQEAPAEGYRDAVFLAEVMPKSAKVGLCGLVDRMVTVLHSSVKIFDLYIRQQASGQAEEVFVEALSSILAWTTQENNDILVQFRSWYIAEKQGAQQCGRRDCGEDSDIIHDLSKVLYRIDKFETSLLKLCRILKANSVVAESRSEFSLRIQEVESIINQVLARKPEDDFSLAAVVETKMMAISEARLWTLDTSLSKSGLQVGKRKRRQQLQNISRRQIRSRNQTVDQWLRTDQEVGADEGADDDAFVDLEDFIVDG